MNLDEQLQTLIDQAPNHGIPKIVMEKAVIPPLQLFALQLQHPKYYLLQTPDQSWIITTLISQNTPLAEEKRVIYAFSKEKDAQNFQGISQSPLKIVSLPVTHLLFQLFSVNEIDSMIFMETAGNLEQGKEIQRANLQKMIYQEIQRFKLSPPSFYA